MKTITIGITGRREVYDTKFVTDSLYFQLESLIRLGFRRIITGGASGFDEMAFWCWHNLSKRHDDKQLENILALPYFKFRETNTQAMRDAATTVHVVNGRVIYQLAHLFERNTYIVQNSTVLIAGWDGHDTGGTADCIRKARKVGMSVNYIYTGGAS